ncbi:hypothetical protein RDI58_013503 [Solanum bulbocastanum]|uniref:Uncharacterized protein n=1 Tax=Solanum bulbocastanum TaxID=147425 RepID=A0AAN8YHT9_SOLBU
MQSFCFCRSVRDVKRKPLDPEEAYQQIEICLYNTGCSGRGSFFAKSLAPDGFPPRFLRRRGWHLRAKTPKICELYDDAQGLNAKLRQQLPDFNFTTSCKSSEVVVGKWYCPFVFIKDGMVLKEQMERSMFYEMTLEQRWEQFFTCQNDKINVGNSVLVDVALDTEVVLIAGTNKATWDDKNIVEGVIWFRSYDKDGNVVTSLGLRREIVQRMKWEQERGGWKHQGRIKQVEQNRENSSGWRRYSCYVLVEKFVLRRMDKSLVMTYDSSTMTRLRAYRSDLMIPHIVLMFIFSFSPGVRCPHHGPIKCRFTLEDSH